MFSASTLALSLVALIPSTLGAILQVSVGPNGQLVYDPPYVHAAKGDTVRFNFNPKNHTVTQSAFDPPCVPLAGGAGFKTGFVPVANGTSPLPYKDITVTNTDAPLWFYCGQVNHCGSGMVFAINPPAYATDPHSFDAFKALAIARNGTASVAPSTTAKSYAAPTPAAVAPQTHVITVGANGTLTYSPANITAAVGDTVTFTFRPKNHTVTQSSFSNPCVSLPGGFKSGFQPVAANATTFPSFTIKINDTAPIWGYCGQVNHCQSGMVFAINAVESGPNNFAAFLKLANSSTTTTSSSKPYATPAPAAVAPQNHLITVGANGTLAYSPANITAAVGDTVTFTFRPKNHTVTQSSFSNPCVSLPNGFKSGFQPVAANATTFPSFTIKINDTAPIWGYCGQVNHCQSGMVFAINAVVSGPNNFAAFLKLANTSSSSTTTTPAPPSPAPPVPAPAADAGAAQGGGHGATVAIVLALFAPFI